MNTSGTQALFAGLVFNEEGEPVRVVDVGGKPHYAIPHTGFLRHVEAEYVDRQVVARLQERFLAMRELITEVVTQMLGQDDPFTRASIEHAIENMGRLLEARNLNLDELRMALWMLKFRVIVDVHGDVLRLEMPGWDTDGDEDQ